MSRTYFLHCFRCSLAFVIAFVAPIVMPIVELAKAAVMFAIGVVAPGAAYLWRELQILGRDAFRIIKRLKPVYRHSYDTNGHSLFLRC